VTCILHKSSDLPKFTAVKSVFIKLDMLIFYGFYRHEVIESLSYSRNNW